MTYRLLLVSCFCFLLFPSPLKAWNLISPDGNITVEINQKTLTSPYPSGNFLYGRMLVKGNLVLPDFPLGLSTSIGNYSTNLTFVGESSRRIQETIPLISGKTNLALLDAQEKTFVFKNSSNQQVMLIFLITNDGLAFRYHLPGSGEVVIHDELTAFALPSTTTTWAMDFVSNYENKYEKHTLDQLQGKSISYPLLAETSGSWVLFTETEVNGAFSGSLLQPINGLIQVNVVPEQTQPLVTTLPHYTPWRLILVGDSPKPLIESNLPLIMSSPIKTVGDWIKPGRVAWSWNTDHASPKSLTKQKEYVDFAHSMGWEYVLVDEGWDSNWIPELVSYAKTKNVGIILWYFWGNLCAWQEGKGFVVSETAARRQFEKMKSWGIVGAKIDFMDNENQERLQFYDVINQVSAEFNILINYHGSNKPIGESRTWPHVLTKEAVLGAEHLIADIAKHNVSLAFTRNIIGPMDYTPVVFSNMQGTTPGHQLALSVIYQSGLQHFADSNTSYSSHLSKPFLQSVPATWDETVFVEGHPDTHIVMARRKGSSWYLGAITSNAQEVHIPLTFLTQSMSASIYSDSNATMLQRQDTVVSPGNILTFPLLPNGGLAIHLSPTTTKSGDANGDGKVDDTDFAIWRTNYNQTKTGGASIGDFNNNGKVEGLDYVIWRNNFGK
jgi:alpha-glucosidase